MYQIKIMLPKRNVEFHINLNNGYATCKSQTLLHTHIHSQHTRRIEIPDQGKKFILLNYRRKKRKKKTFIVMSICFCRPFGFHFKCSKLKSCVFEGFREKQNSTNQQPNSCMNVFAVRGFSTHSETLF